MLSIPFALVALCVLAVASLLRAEALDHRAAKALCKLTASSAFVALAVVLGALHTAHGRWLLLALLLSWVGDACLLSQRSAWFLSGLGAFLLGHVAFAVAFATAHPNGPSAAAGLAVMSIVGAQALRWMWPSLPGPFRVAVGAYVLAIVGMCATAIGLTAATGVWLYGVGAVAFAASDLAVARERFVQPGLINRLWGLPLYYVAQLLLAWTLRAAPAP